MPQITLTSCGHKADRCQFMASQRTLKRWVHWQPKLHRGSLTSRIQAVSELRRILGEDAISTDDEDLRAHGYSEWSSINIDQLPVAVAYPKSTEDVSRIAKICSKYKMPMVPYSGGSSLEANFSAPFGGMSIDFAFMDQILALHADDMDVVVQPSVQWMHLNDSIKGSGLFFPVDPGPSAVSLHLGSIKAFADERGRKLVAWLAPAPVEPTP